MAGVEREVTFREPDDDWLTKQMSERGMSRSAVVHELIREKRERDAARIRHDIRDDLNAINMLAMQSVVESQDPGLTWRMKQVQEKVQHASGLLTDLAGDATARK